MALPGHYWRSLQAMQVASPVCSYPCAVQCPVLRQRFLPPGEGSATREGLESVLAEGSEGWGEEGGGGWKVEFAPYDWSQNSI
eukprot:3206061-Rhodomonas_salina.1